jgi:tRNA-specific 2-thiouridylase
VAAAVLAGQGHDVVGLSMQLYDASEEAADGGRAFGSCCSIDDLHDARRVAAAIGIPHYIMNFEREFEEQVVSNFVNEYASGRTPLPCAHCNSDLKFRTLLDRARGLGADIVATGHYARVERATPTGPFRLKRGADAAKDQSYFLFSLTQDQLAHACFPVGDWSKERVRDYARTHHLPVADKPDSQEICFIPDHDYASFVTGRLPGAPATGAIVDDAGSVLGQHEGVHRFTIGQRKGLGIPGGSGAAPLYVIALKPAGQQVVVGPRTALERTTLTASGVNWIDGPPTAPMRVTAQIRHRHQPAAATVSAYASGAADAGAQRAELVFDAAQMAVTPGQAVVFYDSDTVVGGGWID